MLHLKLAASEVEKGWLKPGDGDVEAPPAQESSQENVTTRADAQKENEPDLNERARHASSMSTDVVPEPSTSLIPDPASPKAVPNPGASSSSHSERCKKSSSDSQHKDTSSSAKPPRPHISFRLQASAVLCSWWNILLICVPIGFIVNYLDVNKWAIFSINFIAIIPLALILSNATEQLAMYTGETIGGLLNATFGNAVELIVSIQALVQNEITIVKTSLLGSMLSNLLLVLGSCIFCGGIKQTEQFFNAIVAQISASLLVLVIGSLTMPTVFHSVFSADGLNVRRLSYGTAVILLVVYAAYLIFQLKTHSKVYQQSSERNTDSKSSEEKAGDSESSDSEEPHLTILGALITLAISTTLVAFCSEFLVSSLSDVTAGSSISKGFMGLIVLPIAGNVVEHFTAVKVAVKNKMDLAMAIAVGSSLQIALFVLPLVVIIGWIMGRDCMNLSFEVFQIVPLFFSMLLINFIIQDGKSNWLEGVLLIAIYVIIAVASQVFHSTSTDPNCPT